MHIIHACLFLSISRAQILKFLGLDQFHASLPFTRILNKFTFYAFALNFHFSEL